MKYLLILLLLLTVETSAQTLSGASDLAVLEKTWRKPQRTRLTGSLNPALSNNPFRANNDVNRSIQEQKEHMRQVEISQKSGTTLPAPPARTISPEYRADRNTTSTSFIYQIKVRNNGAKTIQRVVWEYVFFDADTKQEVGRFQFTSETKLKPREVGKLVETRNSPPTRVIDAKDAGKKSPNVLEQVNIKSIHYTDGSVWESD